MIAPSGFQDSLRLSHKGAPAGQSSGGRRMNVGRPPNKCRADGRRRMFQGRQAFCCFNRRHFLKVQRYKNKRYNPNISAFFNLRTSKSTKETKYCVFILYFSHLFVPLTCRSKVLPFGNKNKKSLFFILFFAHLFVPLSLRLLGRLHLGNENNSKIILHFARFALPLTLGRKYLRSEIKIKTSSFILYFAHLFVPLQRQLVHQQW